MKDVIVRKSSVHGWGVFAVRDFFEEDTVLVIDDTRIVDEEHPLRAELGEFGYHCDYLAGGKVVHMKVPERHINSSCDPSAFTKVIDGVRHVIARRDIRAGEEITYDYMIDCHDGEVWTCTCGSPRCRGTNPSSFFVFELPIELQLEYLPLLSDWFVAEHLEAVEGLRRQGKQNKCLHRNSLRVAGEAQHSAEKQ